MDLKSRHKIKMAIYLAKGMVLMNKTRFYSLILAIIAAFSISAFAKTHRTDIDVTDTFEYTLEEKDKLLADFFVEEDGLYNVKITSLTSDGFTPRISMKILEGNTEIYSYEIKKPYTDGDVFDSEKFKFAIGLKEGEYKMEIENLTNLSAVSFTLEGSFSEHENIEDFNNDNFENATALIPNEKYYGGISTDKEKDFYSFEMPYDGYAFVQMYTPQLKFFTLYDESKNEIGSISIEIEEENKVYEQRTGLAKGKYYISVESDEDFCAPLYSLKIITNKAEYFEKEYNNQKEFATPIQAGKEYNGNIFGRFDEDCFGFSLLQDSGVTIEFFDSISSKDGHYSLWISDGNKAIHSVDECGRKTIELDLTKGTYYIFVSGLGNERFSYMSYKIKVTSDKNLVIGPPEEDNGADKNEPAMEEVLQFADVYENNWYYDELLEAKKLGLINGVGDNRYNPGGNVTIAEVIAMASRIYNIKNGANTELASSPVGKWYNSYVTFAANCNLISIDDFENFEKAATRAEVAYIFSNLFDEVAETNIVIPDVNEETKYSNSIHKLYSLGILKGDDQKGTFYPERNLTRAEAAAILLRVHNSL